MIGPIKYAFLKGLFYGIINANRIDTAILEDVLAAEIATLAKTEGMQTFMDVVKCDDELYKFLKD